MCQAFRSIQRCENRCENVHVSTMINTNVNANDEEFPKKKIRRTGNIGIDEFLQQFRDKNAMGWQQMDRAVFPPLIRTETIHLQNQKNKKGVRIKKRDQ